MDNINKIKIGNKSPDNIMYAKDNGEPYAIECWNTYIGNNCIYHKNKTFENCWLKYKYARKNNTINIVDCNKKEGLILPEINNLNDYISHTVWRCKIKNIEFWEIIRNWYKNNYISLELFRRNIFKDSNFTENVIFNIKDSDNYMSALDAFYGTYIKKITLNIPNGRFTSLQNLFRGCGYLLNIELKSKSMGAFDISGMFEFDGYLKSYPNNLIDWSIRTNNNCSIPNSNIPFAFEASGIKEIPSYNLNDRFADNNTIICSKTGQQAFNTEELIKINPVIDCILIDPMINSNAYLMFRCKNLIDARIKNLNHGDWYLDGEGKGNRHNGYIPKLNKESINYLFANLYDLNKHNPALQDTDDTNPHRNKANLYCPIEWQSNITKQMLDAAKLKNWSIYIGGVLKN